VSEGANLQKALEYEGKNLQSMNFQGGANLKIQSVRCILKEGIGVQNINFFEN
jgi:hypothetical protein